MRLLTFLLAGGACAQSWVSQTSGTTVSLRGVSAVNAKVAWASGSGGTYLHTSDSGATWRIAQVPGAEALDFRGVRAVDARTVYLLSSGSGDKARIYKTVDGGSHWTLQLTNPDADGFFDAIAFWDADHGMVLGDPVGGQFVVLITADGGRHWRRRPTLPALPGEGAFAASNTCLVVGGKRDAWFASGGPGAARVFRTADGGLTWSVAAAPIRNDAASAGIFSISFPDQAHGIAVGGDYAKDQEARQNIAITADGGQSWRSPAGPGPKGFRSAVVFLPDRRIWVATGTSGSDVSTDNGETWRRFDEGAYHAMSFASSGAGWAVGPRGRIAAFRPQ